VFCKDNETWLACLDRLEPFALWGGVATTLLAVIVAGAAIWSSRRIAQRRAAIDYLMVTEQDRQWDAGYDFLRRKKAQGITDISYLLRNDAQSDDYAEKNQENAALIDSILNILEYMAVGIRQGIFCERTLKQASFGVVTGTYKVTELYIKALRLKGGSKTAFQEFEGLAKRWEKYPLTANDATLWTRKRLPGKFSL